MNRVSVLITTHNRPLLLKECLESIEGQIVKPNEIIIIDASEKSQLETSIKVNNITLKYIYKKGLNAPQARNLAIETASNNILFFIDDDCTAEKLWIKKMIGLYNKYPNATIISGIHEHIPKESIFAIFLNNLHSYRRTSSPLPFINIDNCVIIKKKLSDYSLTFDETMIREEDMDIVLQALDKGLDVVVDKGGIVYHKVRPSLLGFLKQRFQNSGNSQRLSRKWKNQKYNFYSNQRLNYFKLYFKMIKKIKKFDMILKLTVVIFLSFIVYEIGLIYYKFIQGKI